MARKHYARKHYGCRRVVLSEPDRDDGTSSAWILLGVAALLIVGNAVFVAAETAVVMVDRNLVESHAREGSVRFGRVRVLCSGCRRTSEGDRQT